MEAVSRRLGTLHLCPLSAREGRAPDRFILTARQGGRGAFRLRAPFVLHDGARHEIDAGEDYTPTARAILRDGAGFPWTD